MTIRNALASLAVKHIDVARQWYEQLLDQKGSMPMSEVVEWSFPGGGGLQVYELPQRAGHGSCTLAVTDIEKTVRNLESLGIDASQRTSSDRVKTVMITDPDGNHIAFAEAVDPSLAR
jgi:predicted enzyme related to lactoylglutathione lyase